MFIKIKNAYIKIKDIRRIDFGFNTVSIYFSGIPGGSSSLDVCLSEEEKKELIHKLEALRLGVP